MKPQTSCSSPGSDFSLHCRSEVPGTALSLVSSFYSWSYFDSCILIPSLINSKEHSESSLESSVFSWAHFSKWTFLSLPIANLITWSLCYFRNLITFLKAPTLLPSNPPRTSGTENPMLITLLIQISPLCSCCNNLESGSQHDIPHLQALSLLHRYLSTFLHSSLMIPSNPHKFNEYLLCPGTMFSEVSRHKKLVG